MNVGVLDWVTDTGKKCRVCGRDHWIVDGTGDFPGSDNRFWLLCLGEHDEIVTESLPEGWRVTDDA